ncbi:MAG: hypothetical protein ACM34H_06615 [Deltaproteobacteria bacterium]
MIARFTEDIDASGQNKAFERTEQETQVAGWIWPTEITLIGAQ